MPEIAAFKGMVHQAAPGASKLQLPMQGAGAHKDRLKLAAAIQINACLCGALLNLPEPLLLLAAWSLLQARDEQHKVM